MLTITDVLIIVVILLVSILLFYIYRINQQEKFPTKEIESVFEKIWKESGFDEKMGRLSTYAEDIRRDYRSLNDMLKVPVARGSFGELALEQILSDQLPPDMFGIRKGVFNGKIPDAHILSTVGIICIDSKFPFENFRQMIESEDASSRNKFKKQFIRDVAKHLDKIAADYVNQMQGSAPFAFAFIPSESVYYFLVTEAYDILRDYTAKGVQVVSPLTLAHKIELIKAGVHARRLSEQAEAIRNDIVQLSRHFIELDENWRIFYESHLKKAIRKADELNAAYQRVKEEFDRISQFTG